MDDIGFWSRSFLGENMMPNCTNCGRPNGILAVGDSEKNAFPICIDCYEKLQAAQLRQAHYYQYAAWEAEEQMNDLSEGWGIPVRRRPPPPAPSLKSGAHTVNNINVSGSQVGSINTGHIGALTLSVSQLKEAGHQELAASVNELLTAVLGAPEFSDAVKNEIVELLGAVAEQAVAPKSTQKPALGRAILKRLNELFADASSMARLWQRVIEMLSSLF